MARNTAAKKTERKARRHQPIWKGSIRFGLVNVPVKLYAAKEERPLRFRMLHDEDGAPIAMERVCSADGERVPYEHVVKGYEIARGQHVIVTRDELASFDPESTQMIEIEDFVDLHDIDPIYYEHSYYLVPDRGASEAYALLVTAMERRDKVGVARVVLRTKQNLCALRPLDGALVLSTLSYADELIPSSSIEGLPVEASAPRGRELQMAERLIESLSARFRPEKYRDEHRERVLAYLRRKAEKGEVTAPPPPPEAPPEEGDLLAALEASLAAGPANEAAPRRRGKAA